MFFLSLQKVLMPPKPSWILQLFSHNLEKVAGGGKEVTAEGLPFYIGKHRMWSSKNRRGVPVPLDSNGLPLFISLKRLQGEAAGPQGKAAAEGGEANELEAELSNSEFSGDTASEAEGESGSSSMRNLKLAQRKRKKKSEKKKEVKYFLEDELVMLRFIECCQQLTNIHLKRTQELKSPAYPRKASEEVDHQEQQKRTNGDTGETGETGEKKAPAVSKSTVLYRYDEVMHYNAQLQRAADTLCWAVPHASVAEEEASSFPSLTKMIEQQRVAHNGFVARASLAVAAVAAAYDQHGMKGTAQGFRQVANGTFIHAADGLFVHIWRSPSNARLFFDRAKRISRVLSDLRSEVLRGPPVCALFRRRGVLITAMSCCPITGATATLDLLQEVQGKQQRVNGMAALAAAMLCQELRQVAAPPEGAAAKVELPSVVVHYAAAPHVYILDPSTLTALVPLLQDPSALAANATAPQDEVGSSLMWFHDCSMSIPRSRLAAARAESSCLLDLSCGALAVPKWNVFGASLWASCRKVAEKLLQAATDVSSTRETGAASCVLTLEALTNEREKEEVVFAVVDDVHLNIVAAAKGAKPASLKEAQEAAAKQKAIEDAAAARAEQRRAISSVLFANRAVVSAMEEAGVNKRFLLLVAAVLDNMSNVDPTVRFGVRRKKDGTLVVTENMSLLSTPAKIASEAAIEAVAIEIVCRSVKHMHRSELGEWAPTESQKVKPPNYELLNRLLHGAALHNYHVWENQLVPVCFDLFCQSLPPQLPLPPFPLPSTGSQQQHLFLKDTFYGMIPPVPTVVFYRCLVAFTSNTFGYVFDRTLSRFDGVTEASATPAMEGSSLHLIHKTADQAKSGDAKGKVKILQDRLVAVVERFRGEEKRWRSVGFTASGALLATLWAPLLSEMHNGPLEVCGGNTQNLLETFSFLCGDFVPNVIVPMASGTRHHWQTSMALSVLLARCSYLPSVVLSRIVLLFESNVSFFRRLPKLPLMSVVSGSSEKAKTDDTDVLYMHHVMTNLARTADTAAAGPLFHKTALSSAAMYLPNVIGWQRTVSWYALVCEGCSLMLKHERHIDDPVLGQFLLDELNWLMENGPAVSKWHYVQALRILRETTGSCCQPVEQKTRIIPETRARVSEPDPESLRLSVARCIMFFPVAKRSLELHAALFGEKDPQTGVALGHMTFIALQTRRKDVSRCTCVPRPLEKLEDFRATVFEFGQYKVDKFPQLLRSSEFAERLGIASAIMTELGEWQPADIVMQHATSYHSPTASAQATSEGTSFGTPVSPAVEKPISGLAAKAFKMLRSVVEMRDGQESGARRLQSMFRGGYFSSPARVSAQLMRLHRVYAQGCEILLLSRLLPIALKAIVKRERITRRQIVHEMEVFFDPIPGAVETLLRDDLRAQLRARYRRMREHENQCELHGKERTAFDAGEQSRRQEIKAAEAKARSGWEKLARQSRVDARNKMIKRQEMAGK